MKKPKQPNDPAKPAVNTATYRAAVADMVARTNAKVVVEVGVYGGGLSRLIAEVETVRRLVMVDPWQVPFLRFDQAHLDERYNEVRAWAKTKIGPELAIEILRERSVAAAARFEDESVDFVHDDADHEAMAVRDSLTAWLPKVRTGGLITGDNYEAPHVREGVHAVFPEVNLTAKGRIWWVRK